jgi:hypothetical protein
MPGSFPGSSQIHSSISAVGPSSQKEMNKNSGACAGTLNRKTRKRIILPDAIANPEKQRFSIKTSKRKLRPRPLVSCAEKQKKSRGGRCSANHVQTSVTVAKSLQQDEVVAWCDASVAVLFLGLPPSSADIADFQDFVFGKADFVGIVGVGLVAVYGLCAVGVFCWSCGGRVGSICRYRVRGQAVLSIASTAVTVAVHGSQSSSRETSDGG